MTSPVIAARVLGYSCILDRRSLPHRALRDVRFAVSPGTLFGVLGPNGSGKSTLFRLLATVLSSGRHHALGEATVAGYDLWSAPLAVRRALGVVFQAPALDRRLTVAENLRHAGHLYGLSGTDLEARMEEEMERFRVSDRRHDRVEELSGGLARRVELAKALLHRPPVLLLDEPSTGLDPRARRHLRDFLRRLADDGVTVLLTTHFIEEAEACDQILLLDKGRTVALGKPADLKAEVGGEVVTLATGNAPLLAAELESALDVADLSGRVQEIGPREVRLELAGLSPDADADASADASPGRLSTLEQLARLTAQYPAWDERVTTLRVSRPTLEDVFLHHTGEPFQGTAPGSDEMSV